MNRKLELLQTYPFEKLANLKAGVNPAEKFSHIALSIGEPRHSPPEFVLEELQNKLPLVGSYAATRGIPSLRQTIADWATRRFKLKSASLTADEHVLPVSGTREALFAFAQTCIDVTRSNPLVAMPNPFYQIYEGAALLAGAKPVFINCDTPSLLPDFNSVSEKIWQDCQLVYLCSPGNPTGAVFKLEHFKQLIELADKHNFVLASDECYSELYFDEDSPPMGLLQACTELGHHDYKRCLVFHSLSKRSNLPGLRSGFVAGDRKLIEKFYRYRTYQGCAMPLPTQHASIVAWNEETHVVQNRAFYREKFASVIDILEGHIELTKPDAGFYLWLTTPYDDEKFSRDLFEQQNVTVLPGSYLARDTAVGNPGKNHIRIALVASIEECIDAAGRIVRFLGQ